MEETFPDPSTSPARYARILLLDYTNIVMSGDAESSGWIRGFSRIVHLEVISRSVYTDESQAPLIPLRGLSPTVRSLRADLAALPSSRVFYLVLSFPLLEDLTVSGVGHDRLIDRDDLDGPRTVVRPSNPPTFAGSLELMMTGMKPIARPLLSIPSGIHFRKLTLTWFHKDDILLTSELAERCSHTLESLDITCSDPSRTSI